MSVVAVIVCACDSACLRQSHHAALRVHGICLFLLLLALCLSISCNPYNALQDIVVVCDESYDDMFLEHDASLAHAGKEPLRFARPGKERQDSVFNGLQEISSDAELVAVHDSARPLVTAEEVDRVVGDALRHGAAVLGVRTKATIKEVGDGNLVTRTLDRSMLWEMHTPQVMRPGLLRRGYELVQREGLEVTDDVSIVEHTGEPVKVTEGEYTNIKLTTPDDIVIAERILANREADASSLSLSSS